MSLKNARKRALRFPRLLCGTQTQREESAIRATYVSYSCVKDEGGPLDLADLTRQMRDYLCGALM